MNARQIFIDAMRLYDAANDVGEMDVFDAGATIIQQAIDDATAPLKAEVEGLREALERIAYNKDEITADDMSPTEYYHHLGHIAYDALEHKDNVS